MKKYFCNKKILILFAVLTINSLIFLDFEPNSVKWTSGMQYREYKELIFPEPLKLSTDSITQYFVPVKLKMTDIYVRLVSSDSDLLEKNEATINLVLKDENNNIIKTEEITKDNIENWNYYDFKVSNLRRGKKYSITLTQTKGINDESGNYLFSYVPFIYFNTDKGEDYPVENVICQYNGKQQAYQMDLFYVYEVPLFLI